MKHTLRELRLRAEPVLLALAAVTAAGDAHAWDIEGGLRTGLATTPGFAARTTPYGFGIGARAGVSAVNLYVGATATAYFGGSFEAPSVSAGHVKIGWSSTLIGGELGLTLPWISVVHIRPQMGIGEASFSVTLDGTPLQSTSTTGYKFPDQGNHVYFEPGLAILVPIEHQFYLGADAGSLVTIVGHPYATFTAHLQAGVVF